MKVAMEEPILRVPLPLALYSFVNALAAKEGYADAGAYVRELLGALQRQKMHVEIADLAREGIESGPATPLTSEDWAEIRRLGRLKAAAQGD